MMLNGERLFSLLLPGGGHSPRKYDRGVLVIFLLPLLVSACSVTTKVRSMFGGDIPFYVTVSSDANENSAVAVDLIVVYDKNVLEQLMKLRAAEWFAQKRQFMNDHRGDVDVQGWEWIPSQVVAPQSIAYRSGARKVVVFADYASDGVHRAAVDPQQSFHLLLDTLDLNVKVAQ